MLKSLFNWFFRNGNSIIFAVLLSIIFYLFHTNLIESNFFFGILGSVTSLYLGVSQYKLSHDKMVMELFSKFNSRYDEDLNDLFNKIQNEEITELCSKQRLQIIDYLNLCAEEYYWFRKGVLPNKIWKAWKSAIENNLNHQVVVGVKDEEFLNFEDSYYGLSKEIKATQKLKS